MLPDISNCGWQHHFLNSIPVEFDGKVLQLRYTFGNDAAFRFYLVGDQNTVFNYTTIDYLLRFYRFCLLHKRFWVVVQQLFHYLSQLFPHSDIPPFFSQQYEIPLVLLAKNFFQCVALPESILSPKQLSIPRGKLPSLLAGQVLPAYGKLPAQEQYPVGWRSAEAVPSNWSPDRRFG